MNRQYTDAERVEALARLAVNAGNIARTARDTGVPKPTLRLWRSQVQAAGDSRALTPADPVKSDWPSLFAGVMRKAAEYLDLAIPTMNGQQLAVTLGIASDKYLDHTEGRKAGVQVTNDNRSLSLPEGTTIDDLRALRDGLR